MAAPRQKLKNVELNEQLNDLIGKFGTKLVEKQLKEMGLANKEMEAPKPKAIPTLDEAEDIFYNSSTSYYMHKREVTRKGYKSELKTFKNFCKENLPKKSRTLITEIFKPDFLSEYINQYKNGGTRDKKITFLRVFLKSVALDIFDKKQINNLLRNTLKVSGKNAENDVPKALTPKQVEFLFETVKETTSAIRNYTILWVLIGSGIRVNGLVNLRIEDVCWEDQAIMVIPKGKETKEKFYMTPVSFEVLTHYIEFRHGNKKKELSKAKYESIFIFSSNTNSRAIATSTVREMMKSLKMKGVQANIFSEDDTLSPHIMRHTFALYALESGIDIYKIQKLLGHDSVDTTQTYLRLFSHQLKEELKKHRYANVELEFMTNKEALYGKFSS
ncbi:MULTISPECIES: tyrosine-type recombinase/integrase [Pontibacillus]|uniref:Tyr recombinase domain-containing protein n=1 Tax=Pontibacillus marinus BH030004 = DSM 16465 TaxID=1385511 RepID=A0A0A5GA71_9BACI|nr:MULTISPECIES: tyrosine-type recombinase/integrase [Pontibacillus]KGX90056.1 hypothetical protein N783_02565 [Pontibacillus marinus BH030004 = DSM 16465]QHE50889.1 tyrosine-type recombinase/integrase [Pontibacillus sp. HMF3514]